MIPTLLVSKVAKEHVTVVLGGDAADEIFGGYERYWVYRVLNSKIASFYLLRNFGISFFNGLNFFTKKDIFKKLSRVIISGKEIDSSLIYGRIFSSISDNDFYELTGREIDYSSFKSYFKNDFSKDVQSCDLNHYLCEDILVKLDRATMANSIEGRTPFLSEEIVDLGLNLVNSSKFGFYSGKECLKKYLEKYLPKEILYRKKKGFGVPLAEYFRDELKYLIESEVVNCSCHNYFNNNFIKQLCDEHFRGVKDNSSVIWNLLMFNLWYKRWIESE